MPRGALRREVVGSGIGCYTSYTVPEPKPLMLTSSQPSVVIHFKDGRVETGALHSSLLTDSTVRFLPQTTPGERRRAPRVPFLSDVSIDHLGVRRGVDLSARGMYVETITPYPVGTIVPIVLRFGKETVTVSAKAVFTDPGIGMGVEFVRIPSATLHQLQEWIQRAQGRASERLARVRRFKERRQASSRRDASPRWSIRKLDRRGMPPAGSSELLEVEMAELKSIFFLDAGHRSGPSVNEHVIVEFRDGDEIQGVLHDLSPEPQGFFIDLHVTAERYHTVYVIKSAVRSIQPTL